MVIISNVYIMYTCHCLNMSHCIYMEITLSQNLHFTHISFYESALETINYVSQYLIPNKIMIICFTDHTIVKFGENHEQSFSPGNIETCLTYKLKCHIIDKLPHNVLYKFNFIIYTKSA